MDGKPTYRFKEGAIGESYALEVAERLELPKGVSKAVYHSAGHLLLWVLICLLCWQVLERARTLMDQSVIKVTELIKKLESQRDELQGEITAAKTREKVCLLNV